MEFAQFGIGIVVALVAVFFVLRNQATKNAELKAYADKELAKLNGYLAKIEAGARGYSDELWDEAKAVQVKVAELAGRLSK